MYILPDLTFWKCINDRSNADAQIGGIDKNGIANLDYKKLAEWSEASPFNDSMCKKCIFLPQCWGGCPLAYNKTKKRSCFHSKKTNPYDLFR